MALLQYRAPVDYHAQLGEFWRNINCPADDRLTNTSWL